MAHTSDSNDFSPAQKCRQPSQHPVCSKQSSTCKGFISQKDVFEQSDEEGNL